MCHLCRPLPTLGSLVEGTFKGSPSTSGAQATPHRWEHVHHAHVKAMGGLSGSLREVRCVYLLEVWNALILTICVGDILGLRVLGQDMVIINDPDIIFESLDRRSATSSGRPQTPSIALCVTPFSHSSSCALAHVRDSNLV